MFTHKYNAVAVYTHATLVLGGSVWGTTNARYVLSIFHLLSVWVQCYARYGAESTNVREAVILLVRQQKRREENPEMALAEPGRRRRKCSMNTAMI